MSAVIVKHSIKACFLNNIVESSTGSQGSRTICVHIHDVSASSGNLDSWSLRRRAPCLSETHVCETFRDFVVLGLVVLGCNGKKEQIFE